MIPIPYALDALNFLAADVRNLFGPFVNVFLVTSRHWTQTDVGLVTTASGLLGIALQTPIGAAIDVTRAKRGVICLTMAAMTVAAAIIFAAPTFWPMAVALSILAVSGDAFAPAVSALTLGLVTRDKLARRLGRNSAFDHGGNIAIALLAGAVGYAFSQRAVFLMVPAFAALTSAAVLAIPADAINHDRARDLARDDEAEGAAAGYRILFQTRPLMIFAFCAMLFHFANAPLLPLVGQKPALQFPKEATAMMSFCMVAAQGVMLPIAILVGRNADAWGAQADLSRRLRRPADSRGPLYAVGQFVLAHRRPTARRSRGGNLRGADAAGHRRHHARQRPIQSGPGRCRDHDGNRRIDKRLVRRRAGRSFRLWRLVPRPRRRRSRGFPRLLRVHAGDAR
jgi:MFS family permease